MLHDLLCLDTGAVVESEDIYDNEPRADCPNRVGRGRLCERFEDRAETEKRGVDQDGRLDGREAFLSARRKARKIVSPEGLVVGSYVLGLR